MSYSSQISVPSIKYHDTIGATSPPYFRNVALPVANRASGTSREIGKMILPSGSMSLRIRAGQRIAYCKPDATLNVSRDPAYALLCGWLHDHGAVGVLPDDDRHVAVTVFETDSGEALRGLAAQHLFGIGEEILAVPFECSLREENPGDQQRESSRWARGAKRLLHEKALGAESDWASYLSTLPESVAHPAFWPSHVVSAVQYAPLDNALRSLRVDVEAVLQECESTAVECEGKDIEWAVFNTITRSFILHTDGNEASVMLPFLDLLNHSSTPNAAWEVCEDRMVMRVVSTATIKRGEQIYVSYGDRPDEAFFALYGFVPDMSEGSRLFAFRDAKELVDWYFSLQDWGKVGEFNHTNCADVESDWRISKRQLDKIVRSVKNALWRSENSEDKDTDLENFKQMSLFVHESRQHRSLILNILYAFELHRLRTSNVANFDEACLARITNTTLIYEDDDGRAQSNVRILVSKRCVEIEENVRHQLGKLHHLLQGEILQRDKVRLLLVADFLESRLSLTHAIIQSQYE